MHTVVKSKGVVLKSAITSNLKRLYQDLAHLVIQVQGSASKNNRTVA
jgi:hypothetical protein